VPRVPYIQHLNLPIFQLVVGLAVSRTNSLEDLRRFTEPGVVLIISELYCYKL
jgi:hypothetical protein